MTWGSPLRWDTCSRPSRDLGMVTHLLGWPGQLSALSSSSMAPFFFFSFFTKESTAFSAHFSSSSPCFQPSSLLTAGLVKEKRELMGVLGCIGGRPQAAAHGKRLRPFRAGRAPGISASSACPWMAQAQACLFFWKRWGEIKVGKWADFLQNPWVGGWSNSERQDKHS